MGSHIDSKMHDGKKMKLFSVLYFELKNEGLIKGATEYCADTYDPPDWRKGVAERYK